MKEGREDGEEDGEEEDFDFHRERTKSRDTKSQNEWEERLSERMLVYRRARFSR